MRVLEWLPDDPYPCAVTETIPEFTWDDIWDPLLSETETRVRGVLATVAELAAGQVRSIWPVDVAVADDPVVASWQLAGITPVGALDQYDLLRSATCEELLVRTGQLARDAEETVAMLREYPGD